MSYKDCTVACQRYFKTKYPTDPDPSESRSPRGCCQIDSSNKCSVIETSTTDTGGTSGGVLYTKCINQGKINTFPEWKDLESITETTNYWMSVPPLYNNGQLARPAFMQIDLGRNYLLKDLIFDFPSTPYKSYNNNLYLFSDTLDNLGGEGPVSPYDQLQWTSSIAENFILMKHNQNYLKLDTKLGLVLDQQNSEFTQDQLTSAIIEDYKFEYIYADHPSPPSSGGDFIHSGFMIRSVKTGLYLRYIPNIKILYCKS